MEVAEAEDALKNLGQKIQGTKALRILGACASARAASSFASLRGVTPNPLLARPFCGLSPDVQKHAGRQSWKGLLRHTVRHLRWQLKVETEFRGNDAKQKQFSADQAQKRW